MAHVVLRSKSRINYYIRNCTKGFASMSDSLHRVFATRNDFPSSGIELLKNKCKLEEWDATSKGDISRSEFLKQVRGVHGLYIKVGDKIDKELLDAAGTSLKVISTMSVGVDHVDLALLKERGIKLGYTPDVLTEATAELTMALLLATSRNLFTAHRLLATGGWKAWSPLWMCGPGLENSTVGIVGFGRIGQSVAKKLIMFQVSKILYTSRSEKHFGVSIGAEQTNFDDLLQRSDFVICSTALTPETQGMFNAEKFSKMKPTAIFVNISRGGLVDQDALISALENGTIRAAGLDVMTPEPLPTDHKLLQLENCCLLPHIGSATFQARQAMSVLTAQNIIQGLEGKTMPSEYPL